MRLASLPTSQCFANLELRELQWSPEPHSTSLCALTSFIGSGTDQMALDGGVLAYNPVRYNIDFHLDHGDCRICRELGRYSTRKVAQSKWQVPATSPAACVADERTTICVAISFSATPAMACGQQSGCTARNALEPMPEPEPRSTPIWGSD